MPHRLIALLLCLLPISAGALGADTGQDDQRRLSASRFDVYDFEPRLENTWEHRDRNGDGWPDYWEPVVDDEHRADMVSQAGIVVDSGRPGYYLGERGRVLQVPFDGTPVAIRTSIPKTVDPDLAYEITAYGRTARLDAGIARIWAVWLHVDEQNGEREIDRDELRIPRGQRDWNESPLSFRRNDLPVRDGLRTNAMRIVCEVVDDPDAPGTDRHGVAWFDDIRIRSRPKLRIRPVLRLYNPPNDVQVPLLIEYNGLIDNIPDAAAPDGVRGKRYARSIEITDLYGRPPTDATGQVLPVLRDQRKLPVDPGEGRTASETINIALRSAGLYYVSARLFGADGGIVAEVSQVIGLLSPPQPRRRTDAVESSDGFGLSLGQLPETLLQQRGVLTELVRLSGASVIKVPLLTRTSKPGSAGVQAAHLGQELRALRGAGIRTVGVIDTAPERFRGAGIQNVLKERLEDLRSYLVEPAREIGPHVESWQWGSDDDFSFSEHVDLAALKPAQDLLGDLASVTSTALPMNLTAQHAVLPPAAASDAVSLYVPADLSADEMLQSLASLLPNAFAVFHREHVYPAPGLLALAPARPAGQEEVEVLVQEGRRRPVWLTLQLRSVPRHERSASAERAQLRDMATKAIVAHALGLPRVFLGELVNEDGGLVRIEGGESVGQAVPRPALLAARVLEEQLGGKRYLGSFELWSFPRQPGVRPRRLPNYVFGDPLTGRAVVALWHDGPGESENLDRNSIGSGPLTTIDLAGNRLPVGDRQSGIAVHQVPMLIEGLSVPMALTRLSVHIAEDPPLEARLQQQQQQIRLLNYFEDKNLPVEFLLNYATDHGFTYERNWTVRPRKIENVVLPQARQGVIPEGVVSFDVMPSGTSLMGRSPGSAEADKYAQITMDVNVGESVRMNLLRRTRLTSDLQVLVTEPLRQQADSAEVILQMHVRWFPRGGDTGQAAISLTPYYARAGEIPHRLPKIDVPPYTEANAEAPPRIIKLTIPRSARASRVWVGLEESGGNRFFRTEVTEFVRPLQQ